MCGGGTLPPNPKNLTNCAQARKDGIWCFFRAAQISIGNRRSTRACCRSKSYMHEPLIVSSKLKMFCKLKFFSSRVIPALTKLFESLCSN
jgi:hypothetical protein